MSKILLEAYHLADQINESEEVKKYLRLKHELEHDSDANQLISQFQKVKEQYEEAQRFGIFHPNYHEAKENAMAFQQKLSDHPLIGAFLQAEKELDQLLYQVSRTIAHSVSKSVKVPTNELQSKIIHRKCQLQ